MKTLLTAGLIIATAFAAEGYKVLNKIKIGGTGGWDYVALDNTNRRLYASHGTSVEVVDPDAGKVVGTIPNCMAFTGSPSRPSSTRDHQQRPIQQRDGFRSQDPRQARRAGHRPEPRLHLLRAQDPAGFHLQRPLHDATVINAKTNEIVATLPLNGKPEFCVVDGAGKIYNNLEDKSEVIEIDAAKPAVTRRVSLAPAEGPSGLAIDVKNKKLFSVCDNKMMAVTDIATMKVIATPAIGTGPDAAGFDPGTGLAFSSMATEL